MTSSRKARGSSDKLSALKEELLVRLHNHTGIDQDGVRKRLIKAKTVEQFMADCLKQADYWQNQGDEWEHAFYYQFAGIYESMAKEATDLSSEHKSVPLASPKSPGVHQ